MSDVALKLLVWWLIGCCEIVLVFDTCH